MVNCGTLISSAFSTILLLNHPVMWCSHCCSSWDGGNLAVGGVPTTRHRDIVTLVGEAARADRDLHMKPWIRGRLRREKYACVAQCAGEALVKLSSRQADVQDVQHVVTKEARDPPLIVGRQAVGKPVVVMSRSVCDVTDRPTHIGHEHLTPYLLEMPVQCSDCRHWVEHRPVWTRPDGQACWAGIFTRPISSRCGDISQHMRMLGGASHGAAADRIPGAAPW